MPADTTARQSAMHTRGSGAAGGRPLQRHQTAARPAPLMASQCRSWGDVSVLQKRIHQERGICHVKEEELRVSLGGPNMDTLLLHACVDGVPSRGGPISIPRRQPIVCAPLFEVKIAFDQLVGAV